MKYVLEEPKEPSFNKVGVEGRIFPTELLSKNVQFFTVRTKTGHDTTIIEHKCDFFYYVLEGSGVFIINDNEFSCRIGNLVVIPQGTKFTYKGDLVMLAASSPPWSEEQEETL